ncbi:MAG: transglutaminase-like domain-containing protein [Planctomycetota bacterium]|nr:transglutaminase-like domain-containing protein [Planctomycetota bacterium]
MNSFNQWIARTGLLFAMLLGLGAVESTPMTEQIPPEHPLGRGKFKKWETKVRFSVGEALITEPFGGTGAPSNAFTCEATELVFPLVIEGNYTRTDPRSIRVAGMIGDRWQTEDLPWKLRGPRADGTAEVVLSFPAFEASTIGMELRWVSESWAPTIDEADAILSTWPRSWPPEVAPYLEPGTFIDSRSTAVVEFVQSITGGRERTAPLYLVAKEITRNVVQHFQQINENVTRLTSLDRALRTRTGTPADMVCLAVASLRAAGIPARPVVGIGSSFSSGVGKEVNGWLLWCEFRLPGAGWVAFDPNAMRGKGLQLKGLREPWPWFGDAKELRERTAISYRMLIPGSPDPIACSILTNPLRTSPGERSNGVPQYVPLCFWGWMSTTCSDECEPFQSSITRTNRTGSLLHR